MDPQGALRKLERLVLEPAYGLVFPIIARGHERVHSLQSTVGIPSGQAQIDENIDRFSGLLLGQWRLDSRTELLEVPVEWLQQKL